MLSVFGNSHGLEGVDHCFDDRLSLRRLVKLSDSMVLVLAFPAEARRFVPAEARRVVPAEAGRFVPSLLLTVCLSLAANCFAFV